MKLTTFQIDTFLFLYQNHYTTLNDHQRVGLPALLASIAADDHITDARQAAYMLATVKHETADTYLPLEEYGKGKNRKYGMPDPNTGHRYYGRGYIQLTWSGNYRAMGIALGIDLYLEPDLALHPDIAYEIMSRGMRRGLFTGVGLGRYINSERCDYRSARKIINGQDCADRIAGYAEVFEHIFTACLPQPQAEAGTEFDEKGGDNNGRKNNENADAAAG